MGLRPFSTNQLLGIAAGCSILAAVICNAVLIPQSRPVSVSYPPSVSSQAETRSTPSPASSPGEGSLNGPESSGALVDINRAAQAELETLPGIGPAMARRIIDYREQNGAFLSPEDLTEVKGIGEKTLEKLLPYIVCN